MIEFEDDVSLNTPSIELVNYKTVQARKFSKDTHLMIITKRSTKEELDSDYAAYLRLTMKQKFKANDIANRLFGKTNEELYELYKKEFEFGKEDMPGYVDTTSDVNIGMDFDKINNNEKDIPMDIITRDVNRDTFVGQLQESMDLQNIVIENSGVDNPAFFTPYEILTYEGLYSDNPDNSSLNGDISVREWFENYTRSYNGFTSNNYYQVWLEKMRSLYSDYDRIKASGNTEKLNNRKQSIVDLGWNPEIEFNEHNIAIGKKRLEESCKYVQDIYEDYSHLGELSDNATAINESIDTNKDLPVYVVLTKGNIPFLSDAIRAFTDSEYSHAGIAFDPELDKIHSFAIAGSSGYQIENIRNRTSVESVFVFFLKKEKVLQMQKVVGDFAVNVNKTTYSMGGLLGKAVNVKYSNGNKYNQVCSSFVNYILQVGGIDFVYTKNNSLASPADIYNALMTKPKHVYKVYEGEGNKYDSKKTSKIVKAIIKAKDSKALHPIKTIKAKVTELREDYIEEKTKANVCYRVTYDGADIYQNIKMGMFNDTRGMKEWENFTASNRYKWDQIPSDKKPSGGKVYYTEKGLKTFNSKVLPVAKLYLDKSKIKTQHFLIDPDKVSYKDQYHIVTSKALSKVSESVELPDEYEDIPYCHFGMLITEGKVKHFDLIDPLKETTEQAKIYDAELIEEALNLPPGYALRPAKESDMDYMYECEIASIEPRLAHTKKVQDYVRKDVKDSLKDTKILTYKGKTVGMLSCCYIEGGEWWYIGEIFIDKEHRGNGIGTTLIKNELSKHPRVRLQVALSNGKAKKLYEKLGFEVAWKDEKGGMYVMNWEKGKSVEEFPDKNEPVIQEARSSYNCISYAMGMDNSINSLKSKGFKITPDDGDYKVEFDSSNSKIWETYVEDHIEDTYWNEYINLDSKEITFIFKENGKITKMKNRNLKDDPKLLNTCNRLGDFDFKTTEELIYSNDWYKSKLESIEEGVSDLGEFERCDYTYNIEDWDSGKANLLWITGLSGSGKSTLAKAIKEEEKNTILVELDNIQRAKMGSWDTTDCEVLDAYIDSKGGLDNVFSYVDPTKEIKWKDIVSDKRCAYEFQSLFKFIIKYANTYKKKRFVVEGVQIAYCSSDEDIKAISNYPIIIKGTGELRAKMRRDARMVRTGIEKQDDIIAILKRLSTQNLNWIKGGCGKESNDSITYFKNHINEAVSMDDEGNMLIYKATLNTLDYGDAINKSSELCKLYKQSSNLEGLKYELCKLWYINCMLEKRIKRNDKNKEKYVNDRRICLNVFKTYMKHVNTLDNDFNFVEYYNSTPYGGAIRIDKNTLKYSIKALKELLR